MTKSESKNTNRRLFLCLVLAMICCIAIIHTSRTQGGSGRIYQNLEVNTTAPKPKQTMSVVFQASHQTDTGKNFNEALTCNAIVEAAIKSSSGQLDLHKVWSFNASGLHHAREGSNTKIAHIAALVHRTG